MTKSLFSHPLYSFFWLAALGVALTLQVSDAFAQTNKTASKLSAPELLYLQKVVREPLTALMQERGPRTPKNNPSMPHLSNPLARVVTALLDGQIVARAWELRTPEPLLQGAMTLGAKVLTNPDTGRILTAEELPRAKLGIAVLQALTEVKSDLEIRQGDAVIILNGFTFGVGLPSDLKPDYKISDLLTQACVASGLRPGVWRINDRTTIFSAIVDEALE
ncbi:MAG: hypothetical protein LBT62_07160 [Deltaproteobacteria bacterium]|jgi:hypothetical protein|nr:hypothetical protein [Deltaproteobacteria bacterium]